MGNRARGEKYGRLSTLRPNDAPCSYPVMRDHCGASIAVCSVLCVFAMSPFFSPAVVYLLPSFVAVFDSWRLGHGPTIGACRPSSTVVCRRWSSVVFSLAVFMVTFVLLSVCLRLPGRRKPGCEPFGVVWECGESLALSNGTIDVLFGC